MSLNYEAEFYRNGLLKTIKIKEHNMRTSYETIEFTIKSKLTDDNGKKQIILSAFLPLIY